MANTKSKGKGKTKGRSSSKSGGRSKGKSSKKSRERVSAAAWLVCLLCSLAGFCIVFIPGYNLWSSVRGAFFGVFGSGMIISTLGLFFCALSIALKKTQQGAAKKFVACLFLSFFFSSLIHIFTCDIYDGGLDEWLSGISGAFSRAFDLKLSICPGAVGALLGGGLMQLFGKAIAFILLSAGVVCCLLSILSIGVDGFFELFSRGVGKGKNAAVKGASAVRQRSGESRERLKEKSERKKADRVARREEKKRLAAENEAQVEQYRHDGQYEYNEQYSQDGQYAPSETPQLEAPASDDRAARGESAPSSVTHIAPNQPGYDRPAGGASKSRLFTSTDFSRGSAKPYLRRTDSGSELFTNEKRFGLDGDGAKPEEKPKKRGGTRGAKPAEQPEAQPQPQPHSEGDEVDRLVSRAVDSARENELKNRSEVEGYSQPEAPKKRYAFPPIDCLNEPSFASDFAHEAEIKQTAEKLVSTLNDFHVSTTLIGVSTGPSVTRYELSPAPGVKISKITGLADDIALSLASMGVRIEAPIPGKSAVGIEVPNKHRAIVTLREIIASSKFTQAKSKLNVALGKDISGEVVCTDLAKMPHLLIAGTTGSGKSVCLNCMIASILYNAEPSQVKLLMIDPKQVEFSIYNGIPHLLVPVISEVHKAAGALAWAVGEMENRYKLFSHYGVRDIKGYNAIDDDSEEYEKLAQIVIFIDELNDLMMVSPKDVEDSICRLAQKARAAGMHLVVATQRPSVDVITGIIKANIPSRLSLSVSSQVDSRTILDMVGAEKLLGNGDMLFNPIGAGKPKRIQGAFLSDDEIERIVSFIKNQETAEYDDYVMQEIERNAAEDKNASPYADKGGDEQEDDKFEQAIEIGLETGTISASLLQRRLKIGYARAGRIVDQMDERGFIGPVESGGRPRKMLITRAQYLEMKARDNVPEEADAFDDAQDFDILSD